MSYITAADGTRIFYKDWGSGQPVLFSHGWPLTSDAWDLQLKLVTDAGYRAIAHDRRGGGRPSQPWQGNELSMYADDLASVVDQLDLRDVVLVGHSTGGGEVTRYMARHGIDRVAKAVLLSAIPTLIVHGDDDQIVPIQAAARKSIDLVKDGELKVYPGAPHGLVGHHEQQFNADLLDFLAS
jgi:non-heme chloroperoxidase